MDDKEQNQDETTGSAAAGGEEQGQTDGAGPGQVGDGPGDNDETADPPIIISG